MLLNIRVLTRRTQPNELNFKSFSKLSFKEMTKSIKKPLLCCHHACIVSPCLVRL